MQVLISHCSVADSQYQKGKTNLDFTEARDSKWRWHQLGHMQPRSRQITTPAPHYSDFYRPDALPAAKPTASKHWRHEDTFVESVWGKSLTCSSSSRENGWARARLSTSQRVTANDQTSLFVENLPWTHRNNSSLIRSLIVYTVGQKKGTNFLLCASLLTLDRNWWIFLYILRNVWATIPCI